MLFGVFRGSGFDKRKTTKRKDQSAKKERPRTSDSSKLKKVPERKAEPRSNEVFCEWRSFLFRAPFRGVRVIRGCFVKSNHEMHETHETGQTLQTYKHTKQEAGSDRLHRLRSALSAVNSSWRNCGSNHFTAPSSIFTISPSKYPESPLAKPFHRSAVWRLRAP